MSFLLSVATEGEQVHGSLRLCRLPARKEAHIQEFGIDMPETSTSNAGSAGSADQVAQRTIEQQVEQIRTLAMQHYPDDAEARNAWMVERLIQRLREYHAQFVRLEVRE